MPLIIMSLLRIKYKHSEILAAIIVVILKLFKPVSCLLNSLSPVRGTNISFTEQLSLFTPVYTVLCI